jgi:serine/threonine protein kinase
MSIEPGTNLGRYEIRSKLGEGGMGEVYRAFDPKINREVAIKVLPPAFCADKDRLARFEHEAQAAGALNHPNILSIYDVDTHDGSPFVVSELLDGETLRDRMKGAALPSRKAIDFALQLGRGLATAHERGIVHRDLKPENIFITKDGRVKILDFGLAKLTESTLREAQTDVPTRKIKTAAGTVLGTVGYMAPEQVRGERVDHRADIFSFGAVLYEMLSGRRAFQSNSAVETMSAILKEDPPELSKINGKVSPSIERVVNRCLEKSMEERFQSVRDIGFALEALSESSSSTAQTTTPVRTGSKRSIVFALAGIIVLLVVASAAYIAWRYTAKLATHAYHQVTFRNGAVWSAKFAPDGHTIVYSAAWEGGAEELFSTSPESPESRSLGIKGRLLGISSLGEMAVGLPNGTLARVPLAGGAPREVLENVRGAGWSSDGTSLAVVRRVGTRNRLEFPIGNVLYESDGPLYEPRVSPKGNLIAFIEVPLGKNYAGAVTLIDLNRNKRVISSGWSVTYGLEWSPAGDEVWFTADEVSNNTALYAVTLSGQQRSITHVPGPITLLDISSDGRVLLAHTNWRWGMICLPPGETKERDLGWFDLSSAVDLSSDGKLLLFNEGGAATGKERATAYLRKTDGSPAVQIGKGRAAALSPDGKWVILIESGLPAQLVLIRTGAGEARPLPQATINHHDARWFPDGKRILFSGNEQGHGVRLYVQDLDGGEARPITPEGIDRVGEVSPDGEFVAAIAPDRKLMLYPVAGGDARQILGSTEDDVPIHWSTDGRSLYVYQRGELPLKVYRLELSSGRKELWKELLPSDPAGIVSIPKVLVTPDGKSYAYSYYRNLSQLYWVEALK